MPNLEVGKIQPKDPDAIVVGTSSAQVVPYRYERMGMTVVNISSNWISLGMNSTGAIMYRGITLAPEGGTWYMDDYTFTNEAVYAIASGADSTLVIQEYI